MASKRQPKKATDRPGARIAFDAGARAVEGTGIAADEGVVDAADIDAFIAAARTRQWGREKKIRMLA